MASIDRLTVKFEAVRYCLVFFPIATYKRVGETIALLTVFGLPVYKRVGNVKKFLFLPPVGSNKYEDA